MRARSEQGLPRASSSAPAASTGAHNAQARGRLAKAATDGCWRLGGDKPLRGLSKKGAGNSGGVEFPPLPKGGGKLLPPTLGFERSQDATHGK